LYTATEVAIDGAGPVGIPRRKGWDHGRQTAIDGSALPPRFAAL
jgi:hypothetical protein